MDIDTEWSNFLTTNNTNGDEDDYNDDVLTDVSSENLNDDFNEKFCEINSTKEAILPTIYDVPPEPTEIYISTKSKIAYLTQTVDLNIFWKIPIISYATPKNGVIKKQIKINSKTPEELELVQKRLEEELYYEQYIISHIDNPNGRIKFKDVRKITIGLSKKDIMSYRSKKKQAFYNCFVMILRIHIDNLFREFHIKVFNTGKLEIPGVQSDSMFDIVLKYIIDILQPYYTTKLTYYEHIDNVLINSNFNCGFYINRYMLCDILRSKYNIQAMFDPCSYPGIQCKFYYNSDIDIQTGMQITTENKDKYTNITGVSFMIFRTGSVLIVGMCDESIIYCIYDYIKTLLKNEFKLVCDKIITLDEIENKKKKKKIRRKTIYILTDTDPSI